MRSLQALDRRLGPPLCALVAPPRLLRRALRDLRRRRDERRGAVRPALPARRVLAIKFWGLGSLQLLTPAARQLRARHPDARITLLTLASGRPLAEALGVFDEVLTLDVQRAGLVRVIGRLLRLALRLRFERYDAVYDFEFLTRASALLGALSGTRHLVGFSSSRAFRGNLHDEARTFDEEQHVACSFRDLAAGAPLGPLPSAPLDPARIAARDRERLQAFLDERLGEAPAQPRPIGAPASGTVSLTGAPSRSRPLVVLNPNAGELAPERRWPVERFAALAQRAVREADANVVVIGSAADLEVAAEVERQAACPGRVLDLAGGLVLGELLALLERADLVVSNDSGPMHLAAALGAPTLGLFGPETPKLYAPLGPRARALHDPPPCSPCINVHDNKLSHCVLGRAECMTNLSVDGVWRAAQELCPELQGSSGRGSAVHAIASRRRTP